MILMRGLLLWALVIGSVFSAWADSLGERIEFQAGSLSLANNLTVWVADTPVEEMDVLKGVYDHHFVAPTQQYLNHSKENWYRFTVQNMNATGADWVLNLQVAMISDAVLLTKRPDGRIVRQYGGMRYDYDDRAVPYNQVAFSLHQEAHDTQTYYLKISTPFLIYFAPTLSDHAHFLKVASVNYSLAFLFIGLLLGVFVYLLVLSTGSASETLVNQFIWFVLFSMLVMMYINGFLLAYLPSQEWIATRMWLLLHIGLQISYLWATKSYFHTRENYPHIHRYLLICIGIEASFGLLMFLMPYAQVAQIQLYFSAQMILAMTAISSYIWWQEKSRVTLFVVGNIGLMCMAALSTFIAISSIAANDWFIQHGYEIGFCWQAIFFTLALSKKINTLATDAAVSEAENKAKNEFIAKMSHEIRTPMHGVLGMVQLLQDTPINSQQKHYLNVIEGSGKTLMAVINDILDYSKLAAGKTELHSHNFNLESLLSELNTLFGDVARSKNLSFNIVVSPEVPTALVGDSIRLRQILTNLLSNAFRFTERGLILLKVELVSAEREVALRFLVRDTGIGIRADDQQRLFKSFSQLEAGARHPHHGTGLGLAICKQFIEMMGGNISVTSRPGAGSDFIFTANFAQQAFEQKPLVEDKPALTISRHILVAEDNEVNAEVISAFLNKLGYTSQVVAHGRAALDVLEKIPESFDMVLMDCEMPIMDGITACKLLRQQEEKSGRKAIPVIAITAHASAEQLQRCQQAGMNGFLVKPVSLSQLQDVLLREYL